MGAGALGGFTIQGGTTVLNDILPNQAGNEGEALITDGFNPSWQDLVPPSAVFWGDIAGNITDQVDLQDELDLKENVINILPIDKGGTNSNIILNNDKVMISITGSIQESNISVNELNAITGLPTITNDITLLRSDLNSVFGDVNSIQIQIPTKKDDFVSNTSRLLGRYSAGSGIIQELIIGSGLYLTENTLSASGSTPITNALINGKNGKTIFCLDGGSYVSLQAALNDSVSGDIIVVGAKSTTWGDATIPANKKLTIIGLQPPKGKNVLVGTLTYSPVSGNIGANEVSIANLFINTSLNQQALIFGGTAPTSLRVDGCYINSDHSSCQDILSNNSGSGSSFYLYNSRVDSAPNSSTNPAISTSLYTKIYSTEVSTSGYGLQVLAGTTEINNSQFSYNITRSIIDVANNALILVGAGSLIQNQTTNGSGISFNGSQSAAELFGVSFDIATGTGKVLAGTGVVGFTSVNLTNSLLGARNTSVSVTVSKVAYTQLT